MANNKIANKKLFGVINNSKKRVYALACVCVCSNCCGTGYTGTNALQLGSTSGHLASGASYT
jgi:hypothetical protein